MLYNDGQLYLDELGEEALPGTDHGRATVALLGTGSTTAFSVNQNIYDFTVARDTSNGGYIEITYATLAPEDVVTVAVALSADGADVSAAVAGDAETPDIGVNVIAEVDGSYRVYIGDVILDATTDEGLSANNLTNAVVTLDVVRAGIDGDTSATYTLNIVFGDPILPAFTTLYMTYADDQRADQTSLAPLVATDFDNGLDLNPDIANDPVDPFVLTKTYFSSDTTPHRTFTNSGSGTLIFDISLAVTDGSVAVGGVFTEADLPASINVDDAVAPPYAADLNGRVSVPLSALTLDDNNQAKLYFSIVELATAFSSVVVLDDVGGFLGEANSANAATYEVVVQFDTPAAPSLDDAFSLDYDGDGNFRLESIASVSVVSGFDAAFADGNNVFTYDTNLGLLYNKIGGALTMTATIPDGYELAGQTLDGSPISRAIISENSEAGEAIKIATGVATADIVVTLRETTSILNTVDYQFSLNFEVLGEIGTDAVESYSATANVAGATLVPLAQEILARDDPVFLATFGTDTLPTNTDSLTPSATGATGYFAYLLDKGIVDTDGNITNFGGLVDYVTNDTAVYVSGDELDLDSGNIIDLYIFVTTVDLTNIVTPATQEEIDAADGAVFYYRVGFYNVITPALGDLSLSYYGYKLIEEVPADADETYVNPVAAFVYSENVLNVAHIDYGAEKTDLITDYYTNAFAVNEIVNAEDGLADTENITGDVTDYFTVTVTDTAENADNTVVTFELALSDPDLDDEVIFRDNLYTVYATLTPRISLDDIQGDITASVFNGTNDGSDEIAVIAGTEKDVPLSEFEVTDDGITRKLVYDNLDLPFIGVSVLTLATGELDDAAAGYMQANFDLGANIAGENLYVAPDEAPVGTALEGLHALGVTSEADDADLEDTVTVTFTENIPTER